MYDASTELLIYRTNAAGFALQDGVWPRSETTTICLAPRLRTAALVLAMSKRCGVKLRRTTSSSPTAHGPPRRFQEGRGRSRRGWRGATHTWEAHSLRQHRRRCGCGSRATPPQPRRTEPPLSWVIASLKRAYSKPMLSNSRTNAFCLPSRTLAGRGLQVQSAAGPPRTVPLAAGIEGGPRAGPRPCSEDGGLRPEQAIEQGRVGAQLCSERLRVFDLLFVAVIR
jgi:hypothetical protein